MGSAQGGIRELGNAARIVAGRLWWSIVLLITGLCALGSQSARTAAILLGCMIGLVVLAFAFRALGVDPFSPVSVVRSMFRTPGWRALVLASALTILAGAVIFTFSQVPELAMWIVTWSGGDVDLTIAFLIALLATISSSVVWLIRAKDLIWAKQRPEDSFGEEDRDSVVEFVDRARAYWREATETLLLVTMALVPAAMLANWAWNVLASVLLPLFVLSVRRVLGEQRVARETAAASDPSTPA